MLRWVLLLTVLYCQANGAVVIETKNKRVPLVFIHGIKGSYLINSNNGKKHWLTGWQTLGFSTPELALPYLWEGDGQPKDGLAPSGVLDQVTVLPYLFEEKIYGPWLETARTWGFFYPFAYDWRRDNFETVALFESFIEKIRQEHNLAKVRVVAHSMGGLITLVLLNKHPDWFERVVFVGVPFGGGVGFLPDLHTGKPVGKNSKILGFDVMGSFPSAYVFFPEKSDALRTNEGKSDPTRFFEVAEWKRQQLAFYAPGRTAPPGYDAFLTKALARARDFRALLVAKPITYPPIWIVSGKNTPTLSQAQKYGPKAIAGWDFESLPAAPGDGRVMEINSHPPEGIPHQTFYSTAEHSAQLNDPAVQSLIKDLN